MNEDIYNTDPKTQKTNLWLPEERGRGMDKLEEHETNRYKPLTLHKTVK